MSRKEQKAVVAVPKVEPPVQQKKQKQPTNLQGLLRFAMEATKSEDAMTEGGSLGEMDEERKKFLLDALKSMTIDVIEILQKQIQLLKSVEKLSVEDDVAEQLEAIEVINDYVDNIDVANDFHKIGGFTCIFPILRCPNSRLRAQGCDLLASLTQNNPYCQKVAIDNQFLPKLLEIVDKDVDTAVIAKAIYAVSSTVRENIEGYNQFVSLNGPFTILKAIKAAGQIGGDPRILIKGAFLLSALCKSYTDLRQRLIFMDCFPILIGLLRTERTTGHEFVLSLLVQLLQDNPQAIAQIKDPKYNFKDIITSYRSVILNREECLEEEQHVRILLHLIG